MRARKPIKDIKPARNDPRLLEGPILASYDISEWCRNDLIGSWTWDHVGVWPPVSIR